MDFEFISARKVTMSIALKRQTETQTPRTEGTSDSGELVSIGEMAKRHNTTLRTLRFYESRGLLKPYRSGMYRYYDAKADRRFQLIEKAQQLGFTLSEIAVMLRDSPDDNELRFTSEKLLDQIAFLEGEHVKIDKMLGALRVQYYLLTNPEPNDP
jgi:DNA-binding transcriptional MerR regulator